MTTLRGGITLLLACSCPKAPKRCRATGRAAACRTARPIQPDHNRRTYPPHTRTAQRRVPCVYGGRSDNVTAIRSGKGRSRGTNGVELCQARWRDGHCGSQAGAGIADAGRADDAAAAAAVPVAARRVPARQHDGHLAQRRRVWRVGSESPARALGLHGVACMHYQHSANGLAGASCCMHAACVWLWPAGW